MVKRGARAIVSGPGRRLVAALFCVFAVAWSLCALADDAHAYDLDWSAPAECASSNVLRAAVDRLNGDARGSDVESVRGEVTHDEGSVYKLHLTIIDRRGEAHARDLEGETCAQVTDAAAVIIALASDPSSSLDVAAPPTTAPAGPTSGAPNGRAAPTPPTTAPSFGSPGSVFVRPVDASASGPRPGDSRKAPVSWDLSAFGGLDFASLPSPAPGFGLSGFVDIRKNRIELRGAAFLPEGARLSAHPTVGGNVGLYTGTLRYCRSLFAGAFDLSPCAGFEAGALVASGVGVVAPTNGVAGWLAPEASLLGTLIPTSHFAITLETEGLVPLVRPHFVVGAGGEVFQPPAVSGRALAGLHLRFP